MAVPSMPPNAIDFFLTSFISIIIIINPLSTIGLFLSLTKNDREEERRKIAFMCSLTAFYVLVFFALTGYLVFQLYSITIEAFRIAGGLVLLVIGMRMLFPQNGHEKAMHATATQAFIVPLAIPMTSGPGAITTAVMLSSQITDPWLEIALWVAIMVACAINYVVLRYAGTIDRKLGPAAVASLIKIMGLMVCAVGVQFMITGLKGAFPLLS